MKAFHPTFVSLRQVLYKDPVAQVRVSGTLSRSFHIHKGTRQGDSLSALTFALCMEPHAEAIRQQEKTKGTKIG